MTAEIFVINTVNAATAQDWTQQDMQPLSCPIKPGSTSPATSPTTNPDAEERVDMWEPHQSRITTMELAECETMHSHYIEQLETCSPKARPAVRLLLERLEAKMLELMMS
jgi:hypothetical protein